MGPHITVASQSIFILFVAKIFQLCVHKDCQRIVVFDMNPKIFFSCKFRNFTDGWTNFFCQVLREQYPLIHPKVTAHRFGSKTMGASPRMR